MYLFVMSDGEILKGPTVDQELKDWVDEVGELTHVIDTETLKQYSKNKWHELTNFDYSG